MWLGFAIAPIVAPVAFVVQLCCLYLIARALGHCIHHASVVVLPAVAFTAGVAASYGIAGCIGMPLAFLLRSRRRLNGIYIHGCAFGWAVIFAILSQFAVAGNNLSTIYRTLGTGYIFSGTAVPIILSATVFWLIVRRER